jgi:hypothetical protein
MGLPARAYDLDSTTRKEVWGDRTPTAVLFRRGRVIQINLHDPKVTTLDGISPLGDVNKIWFGGLRVTRSAYEKEGFGGGTICYYDAVKDGIAFKVAENGNQAAARYQPFQLVQIVVHRKGHPVVPHVNETPSPARCPDLGAI